MGSTLQTDELKPTKPKKKKKKPTPRKEKNTGGRPKKTQAATTSDYPLLVLTLRRIDAGFPTVTELAKRLGITRQIQSHRENKRTHVSADWIVDTAEALRICPYQLGHDLLDEHIAAEIRYREARRKGEQAL